MPDWLAVIILGIVEGITEFLPISSTGHLILSEKLLPAALMNDAEREVFLITIQSGAVIAVVAAFIDRLRKLGATWHEPDTQDYLKKLIFAFVITGFFGLAIEKAVERSGGQMIGDNPLPVAWALLIGGVLFIVIEKRMEKKSAEESDTSQATQITWTIALAFGIAQLVAAVFPGASRSGTTILVGLLLGMRRTLAVEFSFLLGVPTLLAAGGYKMTQASPEVLTGLWANLLLGTIVSAITAFFSVKWLLRYVQTHTFVAFGWYRIALGGIILLAAGLGWLGKTS
jgi:undecaprenyl-diphosphatase